MRKYIYTIVLLAIGMLACAMPAKRGFQTFIQPDGSSVRLSMAGDEYVHWYEDADGRIYRMDADGYYRVLEATQADMVARRQNMRRVQQVNARRARKDVGTINLAPRGIVILANFANLSFQSSNTVADIDSMMNGQNYTYGGTFASAREYFIAQSGGQYTPVFDVVGPVTVKRNYSYYGQNVDEYGNPSNAENATDAYPCDMVVEACKAADTEFGVDFTKYDNDHDGKIDFVYVLYAGKGEADGGAANTIWPHNWDIESGIEYSACTYTKAQTMVDGLYINNYACSGELNGKTGRRNSIGTICHEFGHVLGLPDYYDTEYETNYKNGYTPNEWDIMDAGGYNGQDDNGTCPPNYSPWEKAFFGWITPVNLGSTPASLTLAANGTDAYVAYQINSSGTYQSPTTAGQCYYIENRQQTGWDTYVPGHGLVVWSVNYNATKWNNNEPNNTANNPLYTIVSASGSKRNIGSSADPFPGSTKTKSWSGISSKPILNIAEAKGVITCDYIESSSPVLDVDLNFTNMIAEVDDDVVLLTMSTDNYNTRQQTGSELELLLETRVSNSIVGTFVPASGNTSLSLNGGSTSMLLEGIVLTITPASDGGYTFAYTFTSDETGAREGSFTIAADNMMVVDANEDEIELGTAVTALTVAEAKEQIAALPDNDATTMTYFVGGIVSRMNNTAAQIAQYKNARFYISDTGSSSDELYSFSTKWLNNSDFTTGNEVVAGDKVVILGSLQNYKKGTTLTPEIIGYVYEHSHASDNVGTCEPQIVSAPVKTLREGELRITIAGQDYTVLGTAVR